MQVQLNRWGSSLGLRIPKDLAGRFGMVEGARVDIAAEGDRLVISVPARPRLEDMLAGVTPESFRAGGGFDWGADLGREQID